MDDHTMYSWIYHCSGLAGLVAAGAPSDTIYVILMDDRISLGITREDEELAYKACKNAEEVGRGLIINLPPGIHWRAATDYMRYSFKDYIILTSDGKAVFYPGDDLIMPLIKRFKNVERSSGTYYIVNGKNDEAKKFFKEYLLRRSKT